MQFQISFFAAGLIFGGANSAVIDIQAVDLAFKPEVIHASPGDILEFHFFPHNHSVVMGDFDKPCLAADSGGFYSGFVSPLAGEAVSTSFIIMFWPPLGVSPSPHDLAPMSHTIPLRRRANLDARVQSSASGSTTPSPSSSTAPRTSPVISTARGAWSAW